MKTVGSTEHIYYLNSRYYDPVTGRFINADGYVSTGQGILGNNMYAYCNNNPVMYVDNGGAFPILITIVLALPTIIGGLIGAFVVPTDQKQNIVNEEENGYIGEQKNNDSEARYRFLE